MYTSLLPTCYYIGWVSLSEKNIYREQKGEREREGWENGREKKMRHRVCATGRKTHTQTI